MLNSSQNVYILNAPYIFVRAPHTSADAPDLKRDNWKLNPACSSSSAAAAAQSIPEVLRPYSRAGEDIRQASFHRIVVTTCSSAGMLHHIGLQ